MQWNPGRRGVSPGVGEGPGDSEEDKGRSTPALAYMRAPERGEMTRMPRAMLAHMQTSVRANANVCERSDEGLAHMRTPIGGILRARSESVAAYMQSSEKRKEATAADVVPAYMRTSRQEQGVSSVDVVSTKEIMATMASYFAPGEIFPVSELLKTVREAQEIADMNYGVEEAVEWADGYEFPKEMLAKDLRSFEEANYNFIGMVKKRLEMLQSSRLSMERIRGLSADNPEKDLLCDLAVGMRVPIPVGFIPNGTGVLTPLRTSYLKVHQAVNRMVGETVSRGLGFLLPKELAIKTIPRLHLCTAHWTQKRGKKSGRPIGDMTYVDGTALNTDEATKEAEDIYGPIRHPTIEDIALMILSFFTEYGSNKPGKEWSDLRIWKMDLKGAYTLLSFRPDDVSLFGMEVTGDLIYLQLCGIFGWSCTPAAFQVVTRALKWEFTKALKSYTEMYVDDIIGVCFKTDLVSDMDRAKTICTSLLGPGAVADEKSETGTRLEVIGYTIDLDLKLVSIARKNFLTAVHGFMAIDLSRKSNLKTMQKLASWGSRYGRICRLMRPFCGALNRAIAGRLDRHATFTLSEETRIAIRCWRAILFLVRFNEERFTRTITSFRSDAAEYIVESDASLHGAGCLIYRRDRNSEVCVGASAVDLRHLAFTTESRFQNVCEFIGSIVGILGLVRLGVRGVDIEIRGDSMSALTWAQKERTRGSQVSNAAMVYTLVCVSYGIEAKVATHISGEENFRCDQLSRISESGRTVEGVLLGLGLEGVRNLKLEGDSRVLQLIECCRPSEPFENEVDFISFWHKIVEAIALYPSASLQYPHLLESPIFIPC